MKKLFILLFCVVLCASCIEKHGKCQVNYTIVYPDSVITYDTTFIYSYVGENDYTHIPYTSSYKGSNYIHLGYKEYCRTTCPIRINSYKIISKRLKDE